MGKLHLTRLSYIASLIRFSPFANSTPEQRSKERHRRVALTALAAASAQGISIVTGLISVPLTIEYLGTERYGLWMTMSSAVAILGFADLGMGNGLVNVISEAHGKEDRALASRYVSSAFFLLFGVAVTLGCLFAIAYPLIPWTRAFNVSSAKAAGEVGPAMCALTGCFLLTIPLGIVYKVQSAYQEGFANSLWLGFGNLLGLSGVLLAIHLKAGLPFLVLAMAGGPAASLLINSLAMFAVRRPWLRPRWQNVTGAALRRVLRLGTLFLVIQVALAIVYSSDNIIAAQILGSSAVAEYAVTAKMFSLTPILLGLIVRPLWPAYGESISRGDVEWVRRTLIRSLKLSLFVAAFTSTILVLFGAQIINLWVGSKVAPSFLLLLGLGIWTVIGTAGDAMAMFLNGLSIIRFQAVCVVVMTCVAVTLKVVLAQSIGLPGIIWGMIIAYSSCSAIPVTMLLLRLLGGSRLHTLAGDPLPED
jgi:O-antigen/teichoic acid export membrane protein